MTWIDRAEDAAVGVGVAVTMSVSGAVVWVVRRVFTNQQQIKMLQSEILSRDVQRSEDREALAEVRTDVREMRADVRALARRDL
jgi:uncharacterized membrane protein